MSAGTFPKDAFVGANRVKDPGLSRARLSPAAVTASTANSSAPPCVRNVKMFLI